MKFCATHRHPDSHGCVSTGVASGAGTSKESRVERAPIPLINPVNSASAKNAAGLAALKRSMQNASKKVTDKVATTVNASSSSPSTSTSVRTPPRVKQAVPISASASQSSSVASSSKNVFSSKNRCVDFSSNHVKECLKRTSLPSAHVNAVLTPVVTNAILATTNNETPTSPRCSPESTKPYNGPFSFVPRPIFGPA